MKTETEVSVRRCNRRT